MPGPTFVSFGQKHEWNGRVAGGMTLLRMGDGSVPSSRREGCRDTCRLLDGSSKPGNRQNTTARPRIGPVESGSGWVGLSWKPSGPTRRRAITRRFSDFRDHLLRQSVTPFFTGRQQAGGSEPSNEVSWSSSEFSDGFNAGRVLPMMFSRMPDRLFRDRSSATVAAGAIPQLAFAKGPEFGHIRSRH